MKVNETQINQQPNPYQFSDVCNQIEIIIADGIEAIVTCLAEPLKQQQQQ